MPRQPDYSDVSSLEREFELELEDSSDFEFEEDSEAPPDYEYETLDDTELEQGDDAGGWREAGYGGDYADRFLELSAREFESAAEVDQGMNEVLDDMEREYFFGAIGRGLKKLSKNKLLRSLAQKGLKAGVGKFLPGLQGALQLARGNLKGALLNFGKQALGSVVPGGGAALDAVKALGFGAGEQEMADREAWDNYVTFAREAYEHLADNVTLTADQPAEASRLANDAIQHAIRQAKARASGGRRGGGGGGRTRVVRLHVSPGESVKLIITGA